jgi:hypothetical protein
MDYWVTSEYEIFEAFESGSEMNYQHSMIQGPHLALEIPSSERLKPEEKERESTWTKQQQGKAWATKAQPDLSNSVANYNQLLVCKK